MATVKVSAPVSKTVQSSWSITLIALLIIKVFEKIVDAFFFSSETPLLVSFCVFGSDRAAGTWFRMELFELS